MSEKFLRPNETTEQFYRRCLNLSRFDCSEEEMLYLTIGPRRLPLLELVPITVLLLLLFLTGVVGNVAVCLVIMRHPSMRTTTTNYYLFSLAVSDLLLLIFGLPHDLSVCWHQYPYTLGIVFCKLRALISEAASYVSVLTIVAFSLERYLAICHPLHLYAMAGLRRALRIVAALWAVALVAAAPFAFYTTINYREYPPGSGNPSLESAFCAMLEQPSWYLCELSSLLFFILPALVILCLYVRMGLRIRSTHSARPGCAGALNGVNGSVHGEARQAQSRKTIINMLAAVVIAFFVCWAPFHFQRLFFTYGAGSQHFQTINQYLFFFGGALYYISATVNPVLYNAMSRRYKNAFRETLCCGEVRRTNGTRSSIRETMVNQTSEGAVTRVRSLSHGRRNRLEHSVFRRGSYGETTTLCSQREDYNESNRNGRGILRTEKSTSSSNNKEPNQVMFTDKELYDDYNKVDLDVKNEGSNVKNSGFRRGSYGESMAHCSQKWDEYYESKTRKGILRTEKSSSTSSINEINQVVFSDKDCTDDGKLDSGLEDNKENNININIERDTLHK